MTDLRFALRQLAKAPAFTVLIVALLALAIGSSTAFFSVVRAQVLAPFAYPGADRIVQLWRSNSGSLESNPWSKPDFIDFKERTQSFAEAGLYQQVRLNLAGAHPVSVQAVSCTASVLRVLGVQPTLGRLFTDAEARDQSLAVLSHACWSQRFGGDPHIIGRGVRLNGDNYTVVGVMPAGFEFYSPGAGPAEIELWVPLRFRDEHNHRAYYAFMAVGRLRPGVSPAAANAELNALSLELARTHPDTNHGRFFLARTLPAEIGLRSLFGFGLVLPATLLVLIAASANAAILFLARGASRQAEYAVRLTLGASRWQLVRIALIESFVTAALGCGAGVLLTWNALDLLPSLFPPATIHARAITLDPIVLIFSLLVTAIVTLAAGIPPALTAVRTSIVEALKEGSAAHGSSRTRTRLLRKLVTVQITIALVLVNTALLLLVSYRSAADANGPLASESVVTAGLALEGARYATPAQRQAAWERMLERVRALPGVRSAGVTTKLPLNGGQNFTILADNESYDAQTPRASVEHSFITPEYFSAMGLRLLRGRALEPGDRNPDQLGAVVNRTFAERYWPGEEPLGRHFRANAPDRSFMSTVVGVVEDVRQWDVTRPALPEAYYLYGVRTGGVEFLVARTSAPRESLIPSLRQAIAECDPDLSLIEPRSMAAVVREATRGHRNVVLIVQFFTVATLLMAGAGVYGTLSFQTQQRRREFSIRVALGAARPDIVRLVLRQMIPWLLAAGLVGLGLSLAVAQLLKTAFADMTMLNPAYLAAGVAAILALLGLAAWPTVRRAVRVDPAVTLRQG